MPTVYTPNTVKVCLRFNQQGQETCNVFHVDVAAEPVEETLKDVGAIVRDWWIANLRAVTANQTSLQAVEVTDVSGPSEDGVIITSGLPSAGTGTGEPMPNNVTVATKLVSGFTGRSRRGRKFFVGMQETQTQTGGQLITTTLQIALNAAYQALITALVNEGWQLVINSVTANGVPRAVGLNTPVTAALTELTVDSMRRRLPGRGS